MDRYCFQMQNYDGSHARFLSPREANERLISGEATRVKRKAKQSHEIIRLKKPVEPSNSRDTACSITLGEELINATVIEVAPAVLEVVQAKIIEFEPLPQPIVAVGAEEFAERDLVFTGKKPPASCRGL